MRNQKLSRMAEPLFLIKVYIKSYSKKTIQNRTPTGNAVEICRKLKSRLNTYNIVLSDREFYADHFDANYRSP